MLAVNREQLCPSLAHRLHEHLAAHHQGFLVGQQQAFAGMSGRHAGAQTCSADDGRHHNVDTLVRRYGFESIFSKQDMG